MSTDCYIIFGIPIPKEKCISLLEDFLPEYKHFSDDDSSDDDRFPSENQDHDNWRISCQYTSKERFKSDNEDVDDMLAVNSAPYTEKLRKTEEKLKRLIKERFRSNHHIPGTKYQMKMFDCHDESSHIYLILEEFCQDCCTLSGPTIINVPTEKDVNDFLKFVTPYLKKYNIDANYQIIAIAQSF